MTQKEKKIALLEAGGGLCSTQCYVCVELSSTEEIHLQPTRTATIEIHWIHRLKIRRSSNKSNNIFFLIYRLRFLFPIKNYKTDIKSHKNEIESAAAPARNVTADLNFAEISFL